MAMVSDEPAAPHPGSPNYRVWVPQNQRVRIKRAGEFDRVQLPQGVRLYPEDMGQIGRKAVFLYRDGLANELARFGCGQDALLVWSLWRGYLDGDAGKKTRAHIARYGWPVRQHHASGHAAVVDLQTLAQAISPKKVVPIHTFGAEFYSDFFNNVVRHDDGVWWEVGT